MSSVFLGVSPLSLPGLHSPALSPVYDEFVSHGRAMLGDTNLESRLRRAAQTASDNLGRSHVTQQARGYSTRRVIEPRTPRF